jgi:hypothetical protein
MCLAVLSWDHVAHESWGKSKIRQDQLASAGYDL